jgi:hypothetical protein
VLQRRHKRQPNALTQRSPSRRVVVGGHEQGRGGGLDPAGVRLGHERVVDGARGALLDGAGATTTVLEGVEADMRGDAGEPGAERGPAVESAETPPGA